MTTYGLKRVNGLNHVGPVQGLIVEETQRLDRLKEIMAAAVEAGPALPDGTPFRHQKHAELLAKMRKRIKYKEKLLAAGEERQAYIYERDQVEARTAAWVMSIESWHPIEPSTEIQDALLSLLAEVKRLPRAWKEAGRKKGHELLIATAKSFSNLVKSSSVVEISEAGDLIFPEVHELPNRNDDAVLDTEAK